MASRSEPAGQTPLALSRMIEAMSEAVLVIDHLGVVVAANQAAVDLLDLPCKAAALRPLGEYGQPFASEALRRLCGETESSSS